jgi:hypothetical protein
VFCRQAKVRTEELFQRLWRNTDTTDVRLANAVLDGRHTWLEEGVLDPSIPGPWIAEEEHGSAERENIHRVVR